MMTSSRPRDAGASFASRRQRGHTAKLSISDPSHHVTEAIGTMYGDDSDYSPSDSRPTSILATSAPATAALGPTTATTSSTLSTSAPESAPNTLSPDSAATGRGDPPRLARTTSDKSGPSLSPAQQHPPNGVRKSMTFPARLTNNRTSSYEGSLRSPLSPTLKDVQDDSAGSQFPLTNIENPTDIAQELSNLQALRRMSMDVGNTTTDPDLMFSSNAVMSVPSIAPTGDDDGTDPSRLLWVPASVHPEIAPVEFKTFLERRVTAMKRRSSSADSTLSVPGVERSDSTGGSVSSGSGGSLRRKKSMLSRQVDRGTGDGYVDSTERLGKGRTASNGAPALPEFTLDELVKDPTKAVQKLQQESQGDSPTAEDLPILPMAPGMGLKRSTRTTYRKGGSLRGVKPLPFAKRVAQQKAAEAESTELPKADAPPGFGLTRVQSEPIAENFSRPTRAVRRQHKFSQDSTGSTVSASSGEDRDETSAASESPTAKEDLPVRTSSMSSPTRSSSIPSIVETPPLDQEEPQVAHPTRTFPQRSSSQSVNQQQQQVLNQSPVEEPPARSGQRSVSRPLNTPQSIKQASRDQRSEQTLTDMTQHPSPLPGSGGTRTDSLTFIPTFSPDDKKDKKKKHKDDDAESTTSSSRTGSGWKWFKGSDAKDKKKQQQQQQQPDEEKRSRSSKGAVEKGQDNARLDVLQTSIDTGASKGRESLVLDRENADNKVAEERKKDGHKKSESKKEKDGLFASLFGGSKRKTEKESSKKSQTQRPVTPEPSFHDLEPDVDYNWTRFPLIKERAIYRLAHMKLANPRRSLHSQVLLSNFMYSYLAKVQAMHPQMQIPQSPQQKRLEEERRRKEEEEQYLQEQQMQEGEEGDQGNIDQYNFEYHRNANQYGDAPVQDEDGEYDDDNDYYNDDAERNGNRPHGSGYGGEAYSQQQQQQQQRQGSREYYSYEDEDDGQQEHGRDGDMDQERNGEVEQVQAQTKPSQKRGERW